MSVAPIRAKTVYFGTSNTTKTLVFDESTPLDATHLIVAVLQVASSTAVSTPYGWTELTGGASNGSNQVRMYLAQGNSSINGITVTTPSAIGSLTLLAFQGFSSLTPLASYGSTGTSSASRAVSTGSADGYGVAITAIGLSSSAVWAAWTGGTRAAAIVNSSQRLDVAWSLYDDGPGSGLVTHTASWGASRTQRFMSVVLPIATSVDPQPLLAFSFDENSGSDATDSVSGVGATTVGAWAAGHTNSGVVNPSGDIGAYPDGPASTTTEWTYMAWGRVASASASSVRQILLAYDPDQVADNIIHVEVATNGMLKLLVLQDDVWTVQTNIDLWVVDTEWHHFALVRHGQAVQLYMDGWPEAYLTSAYSTNAQDMSLMSFGLAANWSGSDAVYGDDLRIYDKALSRTQIQALAATPVSPAAPYEPPDPLVQYAFDENSGTIAHDSSSGERHLTASGSPWTSSGKNNSGIQPTASNYLSGSFGGSSLNEYTVMFWFYRLGATPAGYGQFIFDNANYWAEVVQSGEWGIYGDYTTTPIPTNEWHHLAYRKTSGGNIELYQDGVLVLTTSISFSLNLAATWTVGYGGDGPINGRMDDLRIFNVALTQSQIEDYSAVPVASWTAPPPILPIAEYGFNEGSGAYARDSSGNNRTIAVDSSKWVASKNGSGLSDIGFQNAVMGAANLTARTIMMWVALEELPPTNGYYDLINTGLLEDNGAFDSIYINNSSVNGMQLSYYSTNGAGSESDTSFNVVVTAEPFAHIAISTGPGGLKAYFNGEFVGSTPALTRTFGASSVHMSYPGTHELKGNIDDLRIFDHELTEAQIASWMDVPVTGTTAGLAVLPVAEYGFTEGSGTTTADTSGNNKTITVQSSSWTASGKNNSALSGVGFTNANMGSATPSARTLMFWTKISAPPAYSDRFDIIRTGDLYGGENGDIVYFHKGSPDIYPTEVGLYYYYESSDGSHSYDKGYDVIIPANTFVHVAVVNGEGGAQLYFNGTIQGIVTANTVVPGLESVSMSTASYTSSGLVIDELRVFDRELTPEQINYWMNTPIGPTEQRVAFRGRSGGVTQTYVRAAVRISGQTVPIVNGAIRLGGATVPLRLEAGDPSPFDVLGSSTSGRVGSGSLSVPLPSGTGGSVLIFLSGNQLSEPTVPAGWTKVNWSVANPALATGIYQHNSPSSNPTFNVTQALDGGIAAIAFRIRGSITNVSALGASDVVVSPSTTSVNQSLVIRTLVSNLDSPVETNITFPPGTTYQQFQLIGGVDAGAMVAAAASPVIAPATPSGTATWTLNNIDTSRAATWLIELS